VCVSASSAWIVARLSSPDALRQVAALCVDEFEEIPLPFLPFPGWQERAREDLINKWSASREQLLADKEQPHALLVAIRNEAEAGRYYEGVDGDLLGFAELGVLPAPPERSQDSAGSDDPVSLAGTDAATVSAPDPGLHPYLANLAVKTGVRRMGLGRELVHATERAAVELGYDRLYIKVDRQNFSARRLYDAMGYRLVYMQRKVENGKGVTNNLFMRKDCRDFASLTRPEAPNDVREQ